MRLPKTCIYAIQASLYLTTRRATRRYVPIRVIADDLNISYHFLTKILQTLSAADILTSYRGPNGGVGLAGAPEDITVMQIIGALDHRDLFDRCLLGLPGCGESKPCPLHEEWEKARVRLRHAFETITLASMAAEIENGTLRLTSIDAAFSQADGEDDSE